MKGVHIALVCLAGAVLLAPVTWHLAARYLGPADAPAQAEIAALQADIVRLEERLARLDERVDGLDSRTARDLAERRALPNQYKQGQAPAGSALDDRLAQVVAIASRREVNEGLRHASPAFLEELLGLPSEDLGDTCGEMTNPRLAEMLVMDDVGPIRVRMLRPAIVSLRQVFSNVRLNEPALYARISSAGSLCVRRIRGSDTAASAHAYGLAVDLNIDGLLDTLGDGRTQLGLTLLADYFRQEGWIWGAGFGREDSMHFEVSRDKLEQWRRRGEI